MYLLQFLKTLMESILYIQIIQGEVLRVPTTNQTSNSVIEVDGYSKISVEKGENNG